MDTCLNYYIDTILISAVKYHSTDTKKIILNLPGGLDFAGASVNLVYLLPHFSVVKIIFY